MPVGFALPFRGEGTGNGPLRQGRGGVLIEMDGPRVLGDERRHRRPYQVPADQVVTVYPFNAAKRARNVCSIECEQSQHRQRRQIEKGLPCHEGEVTRFAAMRESAARYFPGGGAGAVRTGTLGREIRTVLPGVQKSQ